MMFVTVRHRSFLAAASLIALAAGAGRLSAQTLVDLPVDPPAPLEQAAKPITIENPLPTRLLGGAPVYPGEAMGTGAAGAMVFRLTIDDTGAVANARYIGHDRYALREVRGHLEAAPMLDQQFIAASQDALRGWLYEPPVDGPILVDVEFVFAGDGRTRVVSQQPVRHENLGCAPRTLDWITGSAASAHPDVAVAGDNIAAPRRVKDVAPVYPADAVAQCIEGPVLVEILIDTTGHVTEARGIRYHPLLEKPALDAVRQWEFAPAVVNGQPMPVTMTVLVDFTRQR